jgi:hypothetical protein
MHLLTKLGVIAAGLTALARSPFLAFLIAMLTAAGAIALWLELLMREAAVYIVVLMLPLAFAALAWPARRVWATRAAEMLVALILSKFAIVAVLALGGAAISQAGGLGGILTGLVLVVLAAFAPWALVRFLPLAELASGAAGQMRGGLSPAHRIVDAADEAAGRTENWASSLTSGMRRQADAIWGPAASGGERGGEARGGAADELAKLGEHRMPAAEPAVAGGGSGPAGGGQADAPPAEHQDGRWVGLVKDDSWRIPPMGPQIVMSRPFWEQDDDPPPAGDTDPLPPEPDRDEARP